MLSQLCSSATTVYERVFPTDMCRQGPWSFDCKFRVAAIRGDHGSGHQKMLYNAQRFGFPDQLPTVDHFQAGQLCHLNAFFKLTSVHLSHLAL